MVYLDEICVFSKSLEEHVGHLQEVFDRLRNFDLKLKHSKCQFALDEIKLLGFVVNAEGIKSDPEKINAINRMAAPTDVKSVRSFLGMTGYYRQCIPDYAKIAAPLVKLTRKNESFIFGEAQIQAFDQLRAR